MRSAVAVGQVGGGVRGNCQPIEGTTSMAAVATTASAFVVAAGAAASWMLR
jgi:hypothetical protein